MIGTIAVAPNQNALGKKSFLSGGAAAYEPSQATM